MPEPIIKLKNLEITYNLGKENEFKATRGVSMEVYPGEYVAFFGPSGCGKSTLFYCILGILPPSGGEILVKGENPYSFSPERLVKFQTSTIGIIYQAFYLINSLTVVDNVALPQIFLGVSPGKRRRWAKQLLRRFGIEEQADKYPENLSGGQNQRVSVARAMVNKPDIILADEPTGNLDSVATKQVMDILEEINQKDKRTVVLITHNAAQLVYAHRVFYMKDGKVLRVVPNPEKKQIAKIDRQKTLVTEMDQLSKIYPYDDPVTLKVKSIVNYLTQDINFDQLLRLEEIVRVMIERKIDKKEFERHLALKYEYGGVGLTKAVAEVMAEKVDKILKQAEDVRRYRRRFEQNLFYNREQHILRRLTKYLVEEYKGTPTPEQLRRLKNAVYKRISGIIRKEEFMQLLNASLKKTKEGVGFNYRTAKHLTDYFEKIIAQGIKIEGKH